MKKESSKSFVYGAVIIAVANIMIKVIGAAFKIPLDRFILGPEGMGIYNSSYTIYNWLFVVSTAGLPVAISKMVAESTAKGNYKDAKRIFDLSFKMLCIIGLAGFLILFLGAGAFARALSLPSAYYTLVAMSPSLFFVALMSSYRGYFQGLQNMFPTAISEVIEALGKLFIGLTLSTVLLPNGLSVASAGAISGVTIGTILGFIFLFFYNLAYKKNKTFENAGASFVGSSKAILIKLIKIAIPITIGVSVFTLTSIIDTMMVMNQLSGLGFSEKIRSSMYGYLGRAITLFNLPPTVISAIAISIVPTIAALIALKDIKGAQASTKSALRLTIIFGLPCAIGLSVLAKPILLLVYNDGNYSFLLTVMGLSVALVTLVQVGNAILQALGRVWVPVVSMLVGGAVKVVANLMLVSHASININGAPIGTFLCYLTVMLINLTVIKKETGVKYEITDFILKPVFCAFVMGVGSYFAYNILAKQNLGNTISLILAILAGALIYGIMLFMVKGIKEEEILLIPKGKKILPILKKLKLM